MNQLADGKSRIPLRALQGMWARTAECLADPHVGLTALSLLDAEKPSSWPEPFSLYEHLLRSSDTLRTGIERMNRYARLLRDGLSGHIEARGDRSVVVIDLAHDEPWSIVQLHVGMATLLARRVLKDHTEICEVWFRRPAPRDRRDFDAFFGVPVRFGSAHDGIVCETAVLDRPLPEANVLNCRSLEWRADMMLADLPAQECTVERVRAALRMALPEGDVRSQAIAKRLALSPRTLHRRLQAEGESYQSVLDAMRCELASRDLALGNYSVRQVGQRIGFNNLSAFSRAFKTWTGYTPGEFQQRRANSDDTRVELAASFGED
jgi:AraC-like DNA-binding protein